MVAATSLIGEKHGHLTVIGKVTGPTRNAYWSCRCSCGNERIAITTDLRKGRVISCGCVKTPYFQSLDIADQKFGRLTAVSHAGSDGKQVYWNCRCECGEWRIATAGDLRSGRKNQCVACVKEQQRKALVTHGCSRRGNKDFDIFKIWEGMIERCGNPRSPHFKRYGARGIFVCKKWANSFEAFRDDMGPRPHKYSVERVDNDGPYSPENCIWADRITQSSNRRVSLKVEHDGRMIAWKQYARLKGLDPEWMYRLRKNNAITVNEALAFMLRHKKRSRVSPKEWVAAQKAEGKSAELGF